MREKLFLKIREENEKEISTLKSIKQSLEARLSAALDSDNGEEIVEPTGKDFFCFCKAIIMVLIYTCMLTDTICNTFLSCLTEILRVI